ncbi:MAG: hypothetical protein ACREDD_02285 [Methylocella sp.]
MVDYESDVNRRKASRFSLGAFFAKEWPYFAMLALALFGVAYTSIARQSMTKYWLAIAPFFAVICVITRWRDVEGKAAHLHLIQTEALHWVAVIFAMLIVLVADVTQMMNSDASALVLLTLLALGTFTAGVHVAAWRICLVGVVLGLAVPAVAWLEQATLLLLLVALILVAIAVLYVMHSRRERAY